MDLRSKSKKLCIKIFEVSIKFLIVNKIAVYDLIVIIEELKVFFSIIIFSITMFPWKVNNGYISFAMVLFMTIMFLILNYEVESKVSVVYKLNNLLFYNWLLCREM